MRFYVLIQTILDNFQTIAKVSESITSHKLQSNAKYIIIKVCWLTKVQISVSFCQQENHLAMQGGFFFMPKWKNWLFLLTQLNELEI